MGCNVQCWCDQPDQNLSKVEPVDIQSMQKHTKQSPTLTTLPSSSSASLAVLHEGEVQKFKPGFGREFIQRWLRLTPTQLEVYKSLETAYIEDKPLHAVALKDIAEVKAIQTNKLEVLLREEDEMVNLSRATEQVQVDKAQLARCYAYEEKDTTQSGRLMKKPLRSAETDGFALGKHHKRAGWSFREIHWYSSETRLMFAMTDRDAWMHSIRSALVQLT